MIQIKRCANLILKSFYLMASILCGFFISIGFIFAFSLPPVSQPVTINTLSNAQYKDGKLTLDSLGIDTEIAIGAKEPADNAALYIKTDGNQGILIKEAGVTGLKDYLYTEGSIYAFYAEDKFDPNFKMGLGKQGAAIYANAVGIDPAIAAIKAKTGDLSYVRADQLIIGSGSERDESVVVNSSVFDNSLVLETGSYLTAGNIIIPSGDILMYDVNNPDVFFDGNYPINGIYGAFYYTGTEWATSGKATGKETCESPYVSKLLTTSGTVGVCYKE